MSPQREIQTEIIRQSSQLALSSQDEVDPETKNRPLRFQAGATLVEQLQKLEQSRPSSPLSSATLFCASQYSTRAQPV